MAPPETRTEVKPSFEPIAVTGLSCRLPGGSDSIELLWELLEQGGEAWSPVPPERFNENAFHHPEPQNPNGTTSHRGGHFINRDIRDFDHVFFSMSPKQVEAMDPQQRTLLELTYEAFESAGWSRASYSGSNTSVFVATFTRDFDRNVYKDPLDMPAYSALGTAEAIMANRLSHTFDLRGPSLALDTGCSGSFVALHQACQSLGSGESDAAVVAAANITLGPDHHSNLSTLQMVSHSGRSYPFDKRGSGYGRGEGCIAITLKRLADARRDGDPIRAIIRGTAVNQDGHTAQGITYPSREAQSRLIRRAYQVAGICPKTVSYVECHGTGTAAGDKEELECVSNVFAAAERPHPLVVGSMKGNIGHTENASGLAGLLKAILILDQQHIPPVAGFTEPKPGLPLSFLKVPTSVIPLPQLQENVQTISVNNFGFGGTNAHVIVQPGDNTLLSPSMTIVPVERLFVFSSSSSYSLKKTLENHAIWIEAHSDVPMADVAYTLSQRRSSLPWRFSIVASDASSLVNQLRRALEPSESGRSVIPATDLVFLFTGQGAQWLGMGRELLLDSCLGSVFRKSICTSRDALSEFGASWDLVNELLSTDNDRSRLGDAELAQPATTSIQIALVDLLRSQGINPSIVMGHSSGEIAAAYTAGHLSHKEAIYISFCRGFCAKAVQKCGLPPGAMMSVGLSADEVTSYLEKLESGVATIACVNSPNNVTISGDSAAIEELASLLDASAAAVFYRRLRVDTAYHSYHMRTAVRDYHERLSQKQWERPCDTEPGLEKPNIAFISSVTGELKQTRFDMDYWIENLVSPVLFMNAMNTIDKQLRIMSDKRLPFFVEIGPHSALSALVRQCIQGRHSPQLDFRYGSALRRDVGAVESVLDLAGSLFQMGVNLNFAEIGSLTDGSRQAAVVTSLPKYAWDHSIKHWHESRISREYRLRKEPYHDLLGVRTPESTTIEPRWRHMLSVATLPWLRDHIVDDLIVFPGSGYICMAIEAFLQTCRERNSLPTLRSVSISKLVLKRALVIPESERIEVQLRLASNDEANNEFQFSIVAQTDGKWHEHCAGFIKDVAAYYTVQLGVEESAMLTSTVNPEETVTLQGDEVYEKMRSSGNIYGQTFRGITTLEMSHEMSHTKAEVEIPDVADIMPSKHQSPHIIHPATLDIILHTCLPAIESHLGNGSIMPVELGELVISADIPSLPQSEMTVSTTIKSKEYRAAKCDVDVIAHGQSVLSLGDLEIRSMAPEMPEHLSRRGNDNSFCYYLDWLADVDFLRTQDIIESPLAQIIESLFAKGRALSVLDLNPPSLSSTLSFLRHIPPENIAALKSYDFVSNDYDILDQAQKDLKGFPYAIEYHSNVVIANAADYNVVLAYSLDAVKEAASLINGERETFILATIGGYSPDTDLHKIMTDSLPNLRVQLSIINESTDNTAIVLFRSKSHQSIGHHALHPMSMKILTSSLNDSDGGWTEDIRNALEANNIIVTTQAIESLLTLNNSVDTWNDSTYLIVDHNAAAPILSNGDHFEAVKTLLNSSANIIWLSPSGVPEMYQITGVARTAHAENSDLGLTTIHVPVEIITALKDSCVDSQLTQLLIACSHNLLDGDQRPHREREYQINCTGKILVPRLHHEDVMNASVLNAPKSTESTDSQLLSTLKSHQKFQLGQHSNTRLEATANTHGNDATPVPLLQDGYVEVGVSATVASRVSQGCSPAVGVITMCSPAAAAAGLSEGDRVAVVGGTPTTTGHLLAPLTSMMRLPRSVTTSLAAAVLLDVLQGCFILSDLARLRSGDKILIHGAWNDAGRAAVAVAKIMNLSVTITSANYEEFEALSESLGLSQDDVLPFSALARRPAPSSATGQEFDAVLATTLGELPLMVLSHMKPFGHIIITAASAYMSPETLRSGSRWLDAAQRKGNLAIQFCDFAPHMDAHPALLGQYSDMVHGALTHSNLEGLITAVRDISCANEAARLIGANVFPKVVIEMPSPCALPSPLPMMNKNWNWEATYLIAGGLGDLGLRLMLLLAEKGAAHIVTLSRRTVDEKALLAVQSKLRAVSSQCHLHCIQCDISSERSVLDASAALRRLSIPPVVGIIQSAVILHDCTLESMSHANFLAASQMKVKGTLALESAFQSPDLRFFLTLSSAVTLVGSRGQANYNAGNAVQDALSHIRADKTCRHISLNIGWIEDAVATMNHDSRLRGLRQSGLRPIASDELQRCFDYIFDSLSHGNCRSQVAIGFNTGSLSAVEDRNSTVWSPMFSHIMGETSTTDNPEQSKSNHQSSLEDVVANGTKDDVSYFIANLIAEKLSALISGGKLTLDVDHDSVLGLGIDSLVAIELRNWIMHEFQAPLQSSEVLTDRSIAFLATKIAKRSLLLLSAAVDDGSSTTEPEEETSDGSEGRYSSSESFSTVNKPLVADQQSDNGLEPVPMPSLDSTLHKFELSRQAVDSAKDHEQTKRAILNFQTGPGPQIERHLAGLDAGTIADMYENDVYLGRREPLQDYSTFWFSHPEGLGPQSQCLKAAILTASALDFAQKILAEDFLTDTLFGLPVTTEWRKWLFYTNRRAGHGVDWIDKHQQNNTVAVLRRGHVFLLSVEAEEGLSRTVIALENAFRSILTASEVSSPPVCALTADDRESWANLREQLEGDSSNAAVLAAIDEAAFVVCLDDESPETEAERMRQFLLHNSRFSNRWLDKTLQLIVAANGASASLFEHTKLDALSVRALQSHLQQALGETYLSDNISKEQAHQTAECCSFMELSWRPTPAVACHVEDMLAVHLPKYAGLKYGEYRCEHLGTQFLQRHGAPPAATAFLTLMLALRRLDGELRPTWEIASLAMFSRGRLEWEQIVTEEVVSFVKEAQLVWGAGKRRDSNDDGSIEKLFDRSLFDAAARAHSRSITSAANGHGYVHHLYALEGASRLAGFGGSGNSIDSNDGQSKALPMPELFQSKAWQATRRGGADQHIKIGFLPSESEATSTTGLPPANLEEGGFVVHGEEGASVHCSMHRDYMRFTICAGRRYAGVLEEALAQSSEFISSVVLT